jgi:hypothetical protein
VRLIDARIGGNLSCEHAVVRSSDGPGMPAHGLRTERDLFLEQGFVAEGRGEIGAIGMNDARTGARLNIRGALLRTPAGPALSLDGLQTTRDIHLDDGFTGDGSGAEGTIRLTGAWIGASLHLTDADVTSRSTPEHRVASGIVVDETTGQRRWPRHRSQLIAVILFVILLEAALVAIFAITMT